MLLARHAGQVLSRIQLLERIWHAAPDDDAARVKYVVMRLRRKIYAATGRPAPITAVRGIGYRYQPPG